MRISDWSSDVCSSDLTHAALALTAIARGCHVMCEKPFTLDIGEAKTVLAAAERAGIVHLLGHEFRWGPDRALLAQAIREGRIGTPRFVSVLSYLPLLADPASPMQDWWFAIDSGGDRNGVVYGKRVAVG